MDTIELAYDTRILRRLKSGSKIGYVNIGDGGERVLMQFAPVHIENEPLLDASLDPQDALAVGEALVRAAKKALQARPAFYTPDRLGYAQEGMQ